MNTECCPQPGQVSFYSVLPLVCLPCYWLVSRACGSGQVAWKGPFCLSSMTVNLLFYSVQGIERGGRTAVWKGSHWPCRCSHNPVATADSEGDLIIV